MKKILACLFMGIILSIGGMSILFSASTPQIITFQGQLKEHGYSVSGTKSMRFEIVNGSGTVYWQSHASNGVSVTVTNGVYTVGLGDTALSNMSALSAADLDKGETLYLRVYVEGTQLSPDILLSSSSYSFIAGQAETITANTAAGNSVAVALGQSTVNVGIGTKAPAVSLDVSGIARFGDHTTNYSQFEADGTLVATGSATTWEDLRVPGMSTRGGASAPDLIAFGPSGGLMANSFDGGSTTEEVYFEIQMPHAWKTGSTIKPHIHWAPVNANAGNVKWVLEYSWQNMNGAYGVPVTISVTDAAAGTAWQHQLAAFPDISGEGKNISSILVCRLYRDPGDTADTYGADAALISFDIHYEVDTLGSREPTVK